MKKNLTGPFASLAVPGFRWWFASQVLSSSGLFTQNVAAAWLILQQTGNGLDLAYLTCAAFVPVFLAGSWGGQLVDRFDHRHLLMATQASLLALSGTLAVLAYTGHATLPVILAVSALTGVVNAADNPARQVYAMDLVGRDLLVSAISLFEVILNSSRVIGPALGGVILATAGPAPCFAVNALSFVAPIAVLLCHRPPVRVTAGRPRSRHGRKVREGLRYVRSVPDIRACVAIAAASGLIFSGAVLYPLLARNAFHLDGGGYGALVAAFGLGALPGALLAARSKGQPSGRVVLVLVAVTTCSMAMTAFAPDLAVGLAGLLLSGFASIWYIATANTLVQLRADAHLRGRVMGIWVMALPGITPVTSLLAAALASAVGIRFAYLTAGLVLLAVALSGARALWAVTGHPAGAPEAGAPEAGAPEAGDPGAGDPGAAAVAAAEEIPAAQ